MTEGATQHGTGEITEYAIKGRRGNAEVHQTKYLIGIVHYIKQFRIPFVSAPQVDISPFP
jgi:hypothetical protein